jgi:hypothetical protein
MQHLNSGFNNFNVDDSTHVKNVDNSKNVKKIIKLLNYKYKILSYMCFIILKQDAIGK